ncbi:MAG TPA: tetratricopeptide repeat protein [Aromatoleum sp.]|uniref:tetratricopeptide repeat protein n=1 Tax=Aromatoleum sp. TaxID=2307007 RepID=UPI002B49E6F9|nr:tetratricopeptide repeat protein [Aromatoleum sp.]HJV25477.1 tetratricopeptide repeat protein [Aromatoleum sp.]
MKLPGTEKLVPVFRHILMTCSLIACMANAHADADADYQRGRDAYHTGDLVGSMEPLKKAADAGHARAQALYGAILDDAELDDEAVKYLKMSAAQNDPDGQYGLAKMYFTGEAKAPDDAEAGRLMHAAAAQDHRFAVITLALAYVRGDTRLGAGDSNSPTAGQMLIKAAEYGEVQAVEALSSAYRKGLYGLAVDPAKADYWAGRLAGILGTQKKGARK